MSPYDLRQLELQLALQLPSYYRATMLAYPFAGRSDLDQAELLDDLQLLLELNDASPADSPLERRLVIGTDRSEETYYIKPDDLGSAVYCFALETGKHRQICQTWDQFISLCWEQISEAEEDERLMKERAARRKWWQPW